MLLLIGAIFATLYSLYYLSLPAMNIEVNNGNGNDNSGLERDLRRIRRDRADDRGLWRSVRRLHSDRPVSRRVEVEIPPRYEEVGEGPPAYEGPPGYEEVVV